MKVPVLLVLLAVLGFTDASPELLYNQALAALNAGDLTAAEIAAEKAAARGGPRFHALRDFLLGNAAFARCREAELETMRPLAPEAVFDTAMDRAVTAARFWRKAAASRPDWPEARRNVERALLKIEELKNRKEAARQEQDQKRKGMPDLAPVQDEGDVERSHDESKIDAVLDELPGSQVMRLLEKLDEKEKEKRYVRSARQRLEGAKVEKDW